MTVETKLWDPADRLNSRQAIAAYLEAVLEDGDARHVAAALDDLARARGLAEAARAAGLSREGRALTPDSELPLAAFLNIARALGLKIQVAA